MLLKTAENCHPNVKNRVECNGKWVMFNGGKIWCSDRVTNKPGCTVSRPSSLKSEKEPNYTTGDVFLAGFLFLIAIAVLTNWVKPKEDRYLKAGEGGSDYKRDPTKTKNRK